MGCAEAEDDDHRAARVDGNLLSACGDPLTMERSDMGVVEWKQDREMLVCWSFEKVPSRGLGVNIRRCGRVSVGRVKRGGSNCATGGVSKITPSNPDPSPPPPP